jgi:hypothetical protein
VLFRVLADIIVVLHLLWILFLFFGAFAGKRHRAVRIAHVSGLFFSIVMQVFGWYCPLTHLEVWLRSKQDQGLSYAGSFIVHYVERVIYLQVSESAILIGTVILCAVNGWVYLRR